MASFTFVYVLRECDFRPGQGKATLPRTYVGWSTDVEARLATHNSGKGAKFTRGRKWKIIYTEKFKTKSEAISREYYIKNTRSLRNKIKNENFDIITL